MVAIEQVGKVVGTGTAASCTGAALDAALAGGGFITFNCGGPATIDRGSMGWKAILADTEIDGAGQITIDGGGLIVFNVGSQQHFTLRNLTITHGGYTPGHFAIQNAGVMELTNCSLSENGAGDRGGSLFNGGSMSITKTTFTDNRGEYGGGAIVNHGSLIVIESTFAGNSARFGGAIQNGSGLGFGELRVTNSSFIANHAEDSGGAIVNMSGGPYVPSTDTIDNCTFNDNTAAGSGGAIYTLDNNPLIITNSTFAGNTAYQGAAIFDKGNLTIINSTFTENHNLNSTGSVIFNYYEGFDDVLRNTIIALNDGVSCAGRIIDGGHNLDSGTSCGFSAANGSLSNTDPQLDPAGLQDNGGPTQTVALCTAVDVPVGCVGASPAIDAGDQAVCTAEPVSNLDQRGVLRPGTGDTNCSIGAYEADAAAPEATPTPVIEMCTGDCNGNNMVAINELVLGVSIVADLQVPDVCVAFVNSEGVVDIAQLIKGVNNALKGCGA
jgi:predicted outer membrane repeat protein